MGIQINGQTDIVTSTTAGGKVTIPTATFPSVTDLNATGIVTASSFVPTGSSVPANGMYLPTTNTLAWSTGNIERIRINSSGNLGIGTNNPSRKLDVSSSHIRVSDGYGIEFGNDQNLIVGSSSSNYFQIFTNNVERARIDSSGNFGLGTESPTTRLDIRSTSTVSDSTRYNLLLIDSSPYASGVGGGINFGYIYNSSGNIIQRGASIGVRKENATDGNYASALTFHTTTNSASSVERTRIDSSGRLLIGTSSAPTSGDPQYAKLVVSGNTASSTGDSFINITRNLAASSISSGSPIGAIFFTESSGGVYAQIQGVCDATGGTNDYPGRLSFYTTADSASSQTERMRISNTGRVTLGNEMNPSGDRDATFLAVNSYYPNANGTNLVIFHGYGDNSSAAGTYALRIRQNVDNNGSASAALRIDHTNPLGGTGGALIQAYGNLGNSTAQVIWQVNGQGSQTINRANGDGTLIAFSSNNVNQGSISVSGATVSYNAFLGSHWGRLEDGSKPDILVGTILETVNKLIDWKVAVFEIDGEEKIAAYNGTSDVGETVEIEYEGKTYDAIVQYEEGIEPDIKKHVCLKVNDTPASKAVFGVFLGWDEYVLNNMVTPWNDMYCAGVGNYFIRMAPGQTPQIGDLIESDGTGCGVVQDDDIIRSKTVAKINCNIPQKVYDDGSFLVTCVLYCG